MQALSNSTGNNIPDIPRNGSLFIVSAPSGAGKTTLCKAVLKQFPELLYSVSYTTRQPRNGEQNGIDYYFISKEEFGKNIRSDKWLEWAPVHDYFYGTSAEFIQKNLTEGHDILLDIDVEGTKQILKKYPESITIFILPPSIETLKQRLEKRGTDSQQTIIKRLKTAEVEIAQQHIYKFHIINDSLDDAIQKLTGIINAYMAKKSKDPGPTR